MESLETGAPEVQHRLHPGLRANHPAELAVARPLLHDAQMSEPEPTTENFELVDPRTMAVRQLLVGTMLVVVGVVVTAATYTTARHDGDRYLLAFGPIVIGAIAMVRGFIGLVRP